MFSAALVVTGLTLGAASDAAAWHDGDRDRTGPGRAASYINPDAGAATENPDVDRDSGCDDPDQRDAQQLSDPGTANRNVHNDACLFKSGRRFDGLATFQSRGAGSIGACPDPDGAGPKLSVLTDSNGDGRNARCFQKRPRSSSTAPPISSVPSRSASIGA